MEQLFWKITELGASGSIAILGILLFRWGLRNQEKIFSYILWAIAGIRLLVPVSFGGVWSLLFFFPGELGERGDAVLLYAGNPTVAGNATGGRIELSGSAVEALFPEGGLLKLLFLVWLVGVIALFAKNILGYIRLRKRVQTCIEEGEYYLSDNISGGFVLGFFKPKIYLSSHLTGEERECVLVHEKVHLRRRDYLWKGLAECILCIHWCNPMVWLAFWAFTADMEMSCDEAALRRKNRSVRAEYAKALLAEAVGNKEHDLVPFFRGDRTEGRIRNLMRERKFSRKRAGISVGAVLMAAVLLIPGFWPKNTYGKETEDIVQQKEESADGEETDSSAITENAAGDNVDNQVESAAGKETDSSAITENAAGDNADNQVESLSKSYSVAEGREYGYPTNLYRYKSEVGSGGEPGTASNDEDANVSVEINREDSNVSAAE